ncbi:protein kinase [Rhodopirellula sp. JC740]|uniref:Protein kinase n=1 Tax=Rhodopirellula halodulae TaxID=2894198 RepID=A0ABS8NFL1_9BACT|nr:protein kinase [Rhodopirellula sp. JC740]MCC9642349.1 protein kinase [Rhodopirellula sp. JC740]
MSDSVSQYRRRTRQTAYAIAILVAGLMVLFNAPWRYAQISERWVGEPFTLIQRVPTIHTDQITRAGWPWRYQIVIDGGDSQHSTRVSFHDAPKLQLLNENSTRFWSWGALIADSVVAVLLVVLAFMLWCWRGKQIAKSVTPERTQRRFDIAAASASFLVPACCVFGSSLIARQQYQSVERLGARGGYHFTFEAPQLFQKRIPEKLHPYFLRLRSVELYSPDRLAMQQLLQVPTLRSVLIADGELDAELLEPLSRTSELTSLALNRTPVSAEVCQEIAKCERLICLGIHRCRLDSEMIPHLGGMKHLQHVDLQGNLFALEAIQRPTWSQTCRTLILSRPRPGEAAHLNIYQWPHLERLLIQDSIRIRNDATLTLSLVDLPSLREIHLDRSQKHSLYAKNLPRFYRVLEPIDLMLLYGNNTKLEGLTRFETLDLENVPSIRAIQCQATDLKELRLSDVNRLKDIHIGVYNYDSQGQVHAASPTMNGDSTWLDQIATTPTLTSLDLSGVRFDPEALKRLTRLQYLRRLRMREADLNPTQLDWILSMTNLQALDIPECQISSQWLDDCLANLPKLKRLHADLSGLDQVAIADNSNLIALDHFEVTELERLKLTHLPRLRGAIQIRGEIDEIELVDLPLLDELLIESPWPAKAKLDGLRSLRYFGGGGPELNDGVIDQVLEFRNLDHIVLAYPNVSPQRLQALGKYRYLTGLELPGCAVDDQTASHWTKLMRLRVANFDDTSVSTNTFRWLKEIPSLRRLSIARVDLNEEASRLVSSLSQLASLDISGCNFPVEDLQRLVENGNLETLNLAGCALTDSHLNLLARSQTLRRVMLKDCNLSPRQVSDVLRRSPHLTIDLGVRQQSFFVNFSPPHQTRLVGCNVFRRQSQRTAATPIMPKPWEPDAEGWANQGTSEENEPPMASILQAASSDPAMDTVIEATLVGNQPQLPASESYAEDPQMMVVDLAEFRMQSERAFSTELFRPLGN